MPTSAIVMNPSHCSIFSNVAFLDTFSKSRSPELSDFSNNKITPCHLEVKSSIDSEMSPFSES